MNVSKKQLFAAGLAVAAFAGAGAAIAANRPTAKDEQKAVIDDAAKQLGVQPDKLQSALQQALVNRIEQAVKDGRLTREQADQLEARIKAGDVPITPPFGSGGGPGGFGHHGRGDGPGHGGFGVFRDAFAAAQSYLGVSDQDLRTALQSGKSLSDVAKAKGKTTDGLQNAMVDSITKSADQAVKDGKLTKQQRDDLVAKGTQWVQHEITETHTGQPGGGFGGGPFGHGPGDDGGQSGDSGNGAGDGQSGAPSGDILQST